MDPLERVPSEDDHTYSRDDRSHELSPVEDPHLPGGVELNTAAYGGGAVGAVLLAVVGLVKRRRSRPWRGDAQR